MDEAIERQKRRGSLTEVQTIELDKALLQDQLPGVDLDNFDFNKKLLSNKRQFLKATRLFWLYQNRDGCIFYDQKKWSRVKDKYLDFGLIYLPDIRATLPQVELIDELGLFNLINLDNTEQVYTKDDRAVIEFKRKAIAAREGIKRNLGLTISSDISPIYLINQLLFKVGLKLKRQRKRVDGKLIYVYKLDREILCDGDRRLILEAIERRYQMAIIENSSNKPSTVPSVETNIETEAQIEQPNIEVDGNSTVLPVPINIETEAQVEHLDIEVDGKSAVLPVSNNIETKAQVEHLELEVDGKSTVLPVPNNIETNRQVEHLKLEVDGKSTVLPVPNNIKTEAQVEQPNVELDDQLTVLRVPINIETNREVEHRLVELELQTSGPSAANYIDSDEQGKPSEIQPDLCSHFAKIYDSPEAIEQLALMLSPIDSPEALQDLNKCEFYDRDRYNKAAKLLPKSKQLELRSFAQKLNELEGDDRASSYLERWQREAGKKVKVMLDNAEKMVTKIGQFIGLKLVNYNCLAQVNIDGNIHYYQPKELEFYTQ